MRVLVTYGSERGGTAGIAETVAAELREHHLDVVLMPAPAVTSVEGLDAVVVGGAVYAGRWHKDARRFVDHHAEALRRLPVWLFSSGPIGETATRQTEVPPVPRVARLMRTLGPRGHVTFGGRLVEHPRGLVARMIAKKWAGDWRDESRIRGWAQAIARELGTERTAA